MAIMEEIDLAKALFEKFKGSKQDLNVEKCTNFIKEMFKQCSVVLISGDEIQIRNFGSFWRTKRKSKIVKNPKTYKEMRVDEHYVIRFKPSSLISDEMKKPQPE